jgi:hypothetical protein
LDADHPIGGPFCTPKLSSGHRASIRLHECDAGLALEHLALLRPDNQPPILGFDAEVELATLVDNRDRGRLRCRATSPIRPLGQQRPRRRSKRSGGMTTDPLATATSNAPAVRTPGARGARGIAGALRMNDQGGVFNGDGLHADRSAIIPGHPAALLRSPMSTWEAARGALAELE